MKLRATPLDKGVLWGTEHESVHFLVCPILLTVKCSEEEFPKKYTFKK